MPRQTLDREIHHLQDEVLLLGSMVEQAMLNAIDTLKRRDLIEAQQVYKDDELINEKRYAIENRVLILFATQQPIAHDLRLLAAILEVITELERMGDYAKGIAKITRLIHEDDTPIPIREISRMGDLAVSMLHRSLSAFINEDVNMAYRIPKEDDLVDDLYNQITRKTTTAMIANLNSIDHANYIMWVVHNIERMADRVTNICERTIFIATGELLEIDASDDEWDDDDEEI
jgi:phosphate transport system protein